MADPITTMSASRPDRPVATPDTKPGQVPLSADDLQMWRGLITKAREARSRAAKWWDANLKAYAPDASQSPEDYGTLLNTNRDFTLVERKKADLFYQSPAVTVVASPLFAGHEALLESHQAILNEALGPDGVNAKALVHQVLFDVLCPAGTGWTLMGYDSATVPTEMAHPVTGEPVTVPVPVYEDIFWQWVSPKQALVPHDLHSTQYDRTAAWLGMDFEIPVRAAKRRGWVDAEYVGQAPSPDLHFDHGQVGTGGEAVCHGVLIVYKSSLYRDDRVHPLHMTHLVLIEGQDRVAEHLDSPYQTLDAHGKLTPDSLLGFPFHPCTLRTLTDSAQVPSDCTISRPIVNELNTFRRQMVEQRDANTLRYAYNVDTLPTDALAKIVRSPVGGFIGLPGDAFVGDGAIKELPHGTYPRENFSFNDYLDADLARTHALDANQAGANSGGDTTATEAQIQQSNVNARLGFERGIVLDWYVHGCTKYSTLLMRFLPTADAAAIVGPQAAQSWDSWRKAVPATLAFTALPDASLRTDIGVERKRVRDDYTFFANDPFINRLEFLKQAMPKMGYSQAVINAQPPEKGPEPTKPGLSLRGEDLNPLMPQFPILVEVLKQCGIVISPEAIAQAQAAAANQVLTQQVQMASATPGGGGQPDTTHGGKVAQKEGLSKHATDLTGGMQGSGAMAPMGAGGVQ